MLTELCSVASLGITTLEGFPAGDCCITNGCSSKEGGGGVSDICKDYINKQTLPQGLMIGDTQISHHRLVHLPPYLTCTLIGNAFSSVEGSSWVWMVSLPFGKVISSACSCIFCILFLSMLISASLTSHSMQLGELPWSYNHIFTPYHLLKNFKMLSLTPIRLLFAPGKSLLLGVTGLVLDPDAPDASTIFWRFKIACLASVPAYKTVIVSYTDRNPRYLFLSWLLALQLRFLSHFGETLVLQGNSLVLLQFCVSALNCSYCRSQLRGKLRSCMEQQLLLYAALVIVFHCYYVHQSLAL